MAERWTIPEPIWVRDATPRGSPRLHRLLERAIEMADLSASDIYTLGDWIAPLDAESADNLGLILVAIFLAVGEGSLALEMSADSLRRRLDDLYSQSELLPWMERALADLRTGRFAHVIGAGSQRAEADRHPLLLWDNRERQFLYFQKHLRAEEDLDARLRERVGRPSRTRMDADVARALHEVLVDAPLKANGVAVKWDADQLTAMGLALLRDVVVISGGPGTGKTSVVLTLLRCLVRLGVKAERIALAAPTGRAAQRLTDALRAGVESLGDAISDADGAIATRGAVTLHSLLDYHPGRNLYRRHEENPIAADIVLVDEVSMVSVEQMASLMRALEPTTQLILLGDKDQLPSVDAGAVLGQLVPESDAVALSEPVRRQIENWLPDSGTRPVGGEHWLRDSIVVLRTNHRSEQGIREAARAINRQDATVIETLPKFAGDWATADERGGCWWWPQTQASAGELRVQLHSWCEHVYDAPLPDGRTFFGLVHERTLADGDVDSAEARVWLGRLFQALERTRLLTLVREGPWGCGPINEMMQALLRRRGGAGRDREWLPGTPILVSRSDKVRGLFNGDVGLTIGGADGTPRVVFARQGGYVSLSPDSLPSHELGFAMTVHKSQGSEFQQTLVVLPPTGGRRLLTKELIYTGITRAKRSAILSCTEESLRTAVGRRIVRESGMNGG